MTTKKMYLQGLIQGSTVISVIKEGKQVMETTPASSL